MNSSGVAGNIYPGNVGYLQIGLQKHDVKILKSTKEQLETQADAEIRLVQFDKRKNQLIRDICGLVKEQTDDGTVYFRGVFNIGFSNMEIKIWNIAKEKRKDENSATMFIVGTLEKDMNQFTKNQIKSKNRVIEFEEVEFGKMFDKNIQTKNLDDDILNFDLDINLGDE